jgi:hypothetical protein
VSGGQQRAVGRQSPVARRGFPCGTIMDERILESPSTMKRSHPSTHASRRSCKQSPVRVTSLALYGRGCTQAVMRRLARHTSQRPGDRCETHNQVPSLKIIWAKPATVKPGMRSGLRRGQGRMMELSIPMQLGESIDVRHSHRRLLISKLDRHQLAANPAL